MSVNKVILVGNLGKDPEVRYLEGGAAVCKFPLATSEVYKNREGEKITTTEWHNIVLWRGLAEIAEKYVKKGMQIYLEGRIKTRSYNDQEGNIKYITEIVGDNMQMLSRKSDESQAGSGSADQAVSKESTRSHSAGTADEGQQGNESEGELSGQPADNNDLPF